MSVEAPERIWVWPPLIDEMGSAVNTIQQPEHVEYVRADKLEELAAENERLEAHAQKLTEALDGLINQYALRTFTGVIVSSCEQYPWIAKAMKARSLTPTSALAAALAEVKRENRALREALTPSGATKVEYIGEFFEQIEIRNPNYDPDFDNPKHDEDPNDDEPETIMQSVPVSWETTKKIMKAIAERAARNAGGNDAE